MKKKIIALGLLLTAILSGCGGKQTAEVPVLQEPMGVQPDKTAAYIGDIYNVTYFNSAVVPYVEELAFEIDGTVGTVHFYPGMVVEEGDVLVELDLTQQEARAEELRDQIAHTEQEAIYTDADAQLDIDLLKLELRELKKQDASDQEIKLKENDIARMETALRQTQQLRALDVQAMKNELAALNQVLSKDTLYAPFSGQILYSDQLTVGAQVKAFDPIVFLADDARLQLCGEYIKSTLLESADRVVAHVGDTQYEIVVQPAEEENLAEREETRFDFLAPETLAGKVEAGQYAAICIYTDYVRDALLVPRGAVLTDAAGSYVYVDENGDRVRREVELGKLTDGLAQITGGLQEGEVVYVK